MLASKFFITICSNVIKYSMVFKYFWDFSISTIGGVFKDNKEKEWAQWNVHEVDIWTKNLIQQREFLPVIIFFMFSLPNHLWYLVHSYSAFLSWLLPSIYGPLNIHVSFLLLISQEMEWQKSPKKTFKFLKKFGFAKDLKYALRQW